MTPEQYRVLAAHRGQVLAFTGHRPDKVAAFEVAVRRHMFAALLAMEPREVISGMAVGVDTWAAESALALDIPLVAAIPFEGQHYRWPAEARRLYGRLLDRAARIQVVCPGPYHPSKMQARNEWMVDRAGLLLGYWNGSAGGTRNCLLYAERVKRDRLVVDPVSL